MDHDQAEWSMTKLISMTPQSSFTDEDGDEAYGPSAARSPILASSKIRAFVQRSPLITR